MESRQKPNLIARLREAENQNRPDPEDEDELKERFLEYSSEELSTLPISVLERIIHFPVRSKTPKGFREVFDRTFNLVVELFGHLGPSISALFRVPRTELTRDQKRKLHELSGFVPYFLEGSSELSFADELLAIRRFVRIFVFMFSGLLFLLLGYVSRTMNESNARLWSYITEMNERLLADTRELSIAVESVNTTVQSAVKRLETVESQIQSRFDVVNCNVSDLAVNVSQLRTLCENSNHEQKILNHFHGLLIASIQSNPNVTDLLNRGQSHKLVSFVPSNSSEGVIGFLRRQSSKFAPLCVLSQSSNDLYNLIDPESSDVYKTADSGQAWILFEFRKSVKISEIQIHSGFRYFPRSFDLVLTGKDRKVVRKPIRNAELNNYEIEEMFVQSLKIEQKGPNWEGKQSLLFKSVELFSSSGKYRSGVFKRLFREHRAEIRQFVCVTARDFDLSEVHSLSPRTNVWTWRDPRQWVEIDFLDRRLFVNSYRLELASRHVLRSWSLLGSNDRKLELDEWTKLDSRSETREGEFETLQTFECFGGPFRYFRLVNEGERWDGNTNLVFWHLEFFGILLPKNGE
jgi:hypothetical protein